eukprot:776492-Pelagomonas_calceolata.AAC.1
MIMLLNCAASAYGATEHITWSGYARMLPLLRDRAGFLRFCFTRCRTAQQFYAMQSLFSHVQSSNVCIGTRLMLILAQVMTAKFSSTMLGIGEVPSKLASTMNNRQFKYRSQRPKSASTLYQAPIKKNMLLFPCFSYVSQGRRNVR